MRLINELRKTESSWCGASDKHARCIGKATNKAKIAVAIHGKHFSDTKTRAPIFPLESFYQAYSYNLSLSLVLDSKSSLESVATNVFEEVLWTKCLTIKVLIQILGI